MGKESSAKQRPESTSKQRPAASKPDRQAQHSKSASQSGSASSSPDASEQRSQKKQQSSPDKKQHKNRRSLKSKFSLPIHVWLGIMAIIGLGFLKYYSEQSERFGGFRSDRTSDWVSHYDVLGVPKSATMSQIRQAYVKKAKENHPDTCHDCADTFQRIATAYRILSDATSREAYDSADSDIELIASEAAKLGSDNVDAIMGAGHPVVVIQVYNDWSYESNAFSSMWERAVEKLGSYITFARLHETKDAALISRLIPVRTRLIPALAVFVHGQFQRLIPTGIKYAEFDANLVSVYPDKVVKLANEDVIVKFASASSQNFVVFTQSGKPSMLLKHAALLFEGIIKIGVTSVSAKSVYKSLNVAEPPKERSLLLSQNFDGRRFWRAVSTPAELISSLRTDLAGQVPVLTSAWQYNALCSSPNVDCALFVKCKSKAGAHDKFVTESRPFRANHLRAKHPVQFAIVDFREARSAFCSSDSPGSVVVAMRDATQVTFKPASASLPEFFADFNDADRRVDLTWHRAPKIYARRSSGRWGWNWLLGIALIVACVFLFAAFWSNTMMFMAMTVLMASSIVFQFDWIVPLIRGLFKF